MYLKLIFKGDKRYYVLCVCDSKNKNKWVEQFIQKELFDVLKEKLKVKEIGN